MSAILKVSVPADQFALAETFGELPEAECHAVRLVHHGTDRVVPMLWVTGVDGTRAAEVMAADPTTSNVRLVSQHNQDSLLRMRWTGRVELLTDTLVHENGAVVSARGTSDTWTFQLLFPDRDGVSTTYDACEGYDVTVEQIASLDESAFGDVRLTDHQADALRTALDNGYYAVPRETTLEELSTEIGVSHQALSERLRRSHRTLVESVIAH
mgnify:CR=1 FL=1